ncbi:MAG: hypothetical protein ABIH03_00810 [Pseudomonadota bacterium]
MPEVRITSKLDSTGVKRGAGEIKQSVGGVGESFGALKGIIAGAFSIGAITAFTKSIVELGSTLTHTAAQMGVSVETLQTLEIAGIKAGVGTDLIRQAFVKLQMEMGRAKEGEKTQLEMFERIGLSAEDLIRMSPEQVFERIARSATTARRGSSEFAAVMEILGTRSGAQLAQVLQEIAAKGLPAMAGELKKTGILLSTEVAGNLESIGTAWDLLWREMRATAAPATAEILGGVRELFAGWNAEYKRMQEASQRGDIARALPIRMGIEANLKLLELFGMDVDALRDKLDMLKDKTEDLKAPAAPSPARSGAAGEAADAAAKADEMDALHARRRDERAKANAAPLERILKLRKEIAGVAIEQELAIATPARRLEILDEIVDAIDAKQREIPARMAELRKAIADSIAKLSPAQAAEVEAGKIDLKLAEPEQIKALQRIEEERLDLVKKRASAEKEIAGALKDQSKTQEEAAKLREGLGEVVERVTVNMPGADRLARIGGVIADFSSQMGKAQREANVKQAVDAWARTNAEKLDGIKGELGGLPNELAQALKQFLGWG